jgi:hypothetical protein
MHLLYVNYWLESTAITLFHDNTNLLKFSFKKIRNSDIVYWEM